MKKKMKKRVGKRLLTALLALCMVIGFVPVAVPTAEAANEGQAYVSLPITIRDYAADGMLFEYNDQGQTGDYVVGTGGTEPNARFAAAEDNLSNSGFNESSGTDSDGTAYVRYTASNNNPIITYQIIGSLTRADLRYCVLKYRTNAASNGTPQISMRTGGGGTNNYTNVPTDGYNKTSEWTTVVFDTGTSSDVVSYASFYVKINSGKYIDIAYIAFFADEEDANIYAENDGVISQQTIYHYGNTVGYGLLQTTGATHIDDGESIALGADTIEGSEVVSQGTWNSSVEPDPKEVTLNSGAKQDLYGALVRTNLVEGTLGANGKPVYTKATVDYLAKYLQATLPDAWENDDGSFNLWYVMGTQLSELGGDDLATKFRAQITEMGTYKEAKADYDAGLLSDYTAVDSYYDAAYFLLHNTFDDSVGYGQTVPQYKELQLVEKTEDGKTSYVFNSAYDNSVYDTVEGVIYNTQTDTMTARQVDENKDGVYEDQYVRGNLQPENRFDPIGDLGYGKSSNRYAEVVNSGDLEKYYSKTNYNLTLEGHAQFIYYEDDDLYFTFTGDDDVYLYINGVRVLDLGGGHAISKASIDLNKVKDLCGLEDGEAYDFDFYYMERHGTAANFGIETNIKIVDPAMLTQKTGYQNGVGVDYNGFVDPAKPVTYSYTLTNKGEAPISNLQFNDEAIGVYLTPTAITLNSKTDISDLSVTVYAADGSVKQSAAAGSLTETELKELLTAGIAVDEKIVIYGFNYEIPAKDWVATTDDLETERIESAYFNNTVETVGEVLADNSVEQTLYGIADFRVQKAAYHFPDTHYYAWGKLDTDKADGTLLAPAGTVTNSVTMSAAEVLAVINEGLKEAGVAELTALDPDVLKICSQSGVTVTNDEAQKNSDGSITYTAAKTGADNFYFKYKASDEVVYGPIRVTVYTYGVADNVYVLDYNLPVELNGSSFGLATNDVLTLADNPYTMSESMAMSNPSSNYGDFTYTASGESSVEAVRGGTSIKYTMTDFMSGTDTATVTIELLESGASAVSKTTGVAMTQTLTVAPASVVYYEDDFVDITYVNSSTDSDGNVWAEYVSKDHTGKEEQSADQNSNYGSDPNYSSDRKFGNLTLNQEKLKSDIINTISGYAGKMYDNLPTAVKSKVDKIFGNVKNRYEDALAGTASNGTIHRLELVPGTSSTEILYFDFVGTGFEIIGRSTQQASAVLLANVTEGTTDENGVFTAGDVNGDSEITTHSQPVITESQGGDVYEEPYLKVEGLPYGSYRVSLRASSASGAERDIYIDGIRIFEPLGAEDTAGNNYLEELYYQTDEAEAEFYEIRPLILIDKTVAYMSVRNGKITWGSGTVKVEDVADDDAGGSLQTTTSEDVNGSYLLNGPNNQLFLDATSTSGTSQGAELIVFQIQKDAAVTDDAARTLQVGAHRKIDSTIADENGTVLDNTAPVYLIYGSTAEQIATGTDNIVAISSGTEQYITIDPAKLNWNGDVATVLLGTIGGENIGSNVLALTSLKVSGYTITTYAGASVDEINGENVTATDLGGIGYSLRSLLATPIVEETPTVPETPAEPEIPEEPAEPEGPAVNEDLKVKSAVFTSKRARRGAEIFLIVETTTDAERIVVLDEDGFEVEYELVSVMENKIKNKLRGAFYGFGKSAGKNVRTETTEIYTLKLIARGESRGKVSFTVYAVDANGAVSANQKNASFTIR